jgi:hypothetical protein
MHILYEIYFKNCICIVISYNANTELFSVGFNFFHPTILILNIRKHIQWSGSYFHAYPCVDVHKNAYEFL